MHGPCNNANKVLGVCWRMWSSLFNETAGIVLPILTRVFFLHDHDECLSAIVHTTAVSFFVKMTCYHSC